MKALSEKSIDELVAIGVREFNVSEEEAERLIENNPERVFGALRFIFQEKCLKKLKCNYDEVKVLVLRQDMFDLDEFFRTGDTLCSWGDFCKKIVPSSLDTESVPKMLSVLVFSLIQCANDEQIQLELPDKHVFKDNNIFCCHLASMLARQAGGVEGVLSNKHDNLFYVLTNSNKTVTVKVAWCGDTNRWDISIHGHANYAFWGVGSCVFSANI